MRRLMAAALVLAILLVPAILLAQAADPGAPVPAAQSLAQTILMGVLNGAAIGLLGYLATKKDAGDRVSFDFAKFGATIVVGALVGGFASWRNKDLSDIVNWADSSGYIVIAQMVLKAVWRNSPVVIQDAVNSLKKGKTNGNPPVSPLPA